MKKIFSILTVIIFFCLNAYAEPLKGGVSEDYIPKGFFGSFGVISKMNYSNNPKIFNYESRDVWTLSGFGNKLILENLESGARSEILIKDKSPDGKTLKFNREKVVSKKNEKTVYKETVTFMLMGKNFSGTDEFVVERYKDGKFIKKDIANYHVAGVKLD